MKKVFIDVNGTSQGMMIRESSPEKPVLLFIHGGPGRPTYSNFRYFHLLEEMEKHATLCFHEQRGAGLSYSKTIPTDTLNLDQYVNDIRVVTEYLRLRYNKEKVFVMGHSCGSMIGMHLVNRYPELFHAYVGIGQIGDQLKSEEEKYYFLLENAKANGNLRFAKILESQTLNNAYLSSYEYMVRAQMNLSKYGAGFLHDENLSNREIIRIYSNDPSYTAEEKKNILVGTIQAIEYFWPEVLARGTKEITALQVPMYIMHGIFDYQTSYAQSSETFERVSAPIKEFYTFEESAHSPMFNEPEKFLSLTQTILEKHS